VITDNRSQLRFRLEKDTAERKEMLKERQAPYDDPFALLAAVIKNQIKLPPYDPSSLENNMIVMEILEAAKKSARTHKAEKL
jgi:hypothetical protein